MLTSAPEATMCNSYWAQGGIIYRAIDDAPGLLAEDIYRAGAGLSEGPAVNKLCVEGPEIVERLLLDAHGVIPAANVPFDRDADGHLSLCLEASHNRARIIHWKDHTGRAITEHIIRAAAMHPNVTLACDTTGTDLALAHDGQGGERRCVGVHTLVKKGEEAYERVDYLAPHVVLATGGIGALYEHTSNPQAARGEGLGMAIRADAELKNLEYVQFHPTTLYIPGAPRFLLTEALRGEGAVLRDRSGRAFARDYHDDGELAPRDIVARMITSEMEAQGEDCMFLDISHRDSAWLRSRFPSIDEHVRALGFDMTKAALPVVPASHYHCGGVATDTEAKTSIPGLLAAGEVACTGLHGGNRLASTSLLEGLVWGHAAAETAIYEKKAGENFIYRNSHRIHTGFFAGRDDSVSLYASVDTEGIMEQLKKCMWEDVGVVRTPASLGAARTRLLEIRWLAEELVERSSNKTPDLAKLRNAATAAAAISEAASRNMVSAGAHYVDTTKEQEQSDCAYGLDSKELQNAM
eukprot:scaffold1954_cov268-Pinguiococcus_pyrenoidosus.AAC.5